MHVDWLTMQNGSYEFPPQAGLRANAVPMEAPGGGRQSVVRITDDGEYLMAGSDVGGFAYDDLSTPDDDWKAANGLGNLWDEGNELGVWDMWGPDASLVFVLTGNKADAQSGGLGLSTAGAPGSSGWEALVPGKELGFSKHFDDCESSSSKPVGSGKLILGTEVGQGASLYVASQGYRSRGIWLVNYQSPTNNAACEPFEPAGEIRIYVSSRTCGAALITFYRGYESLAVWTRINLDSDSAAVSGHEACVLPDTWLVGVNTNRDGSIVLWHGGGGNAQNVNLTLVCATYPGVSGTEVVVKPTGVNGKVRTMLAHPNVDDTWFFGTLNGDLYDLDGTYDPAGSGEDGCDPSTGSSTISCSPNAVFLLQRRYNPGAARFDWHARPLVQEDLAAPRIQDLAWGAGFDGASGSLAMDHLYITTAGSGTYDATLSW